MKDDYQYIIDFTVDTDSHDLHFYHGDEEVGEVKFRVGNKKHNGFVYVRFIPRAFYHINQRLEFQENNADYNWELFLKLHDTLNHISDADEEEIGYRGHDCSSHEYYSGSVYAYELDEVLEKFLNKFLGM